MKKIWNCHHVLSNMIGSTTCTHDKKPKAIIIVGVEDSAATEAIKRDFIERGFEQPIIIMQPEIAAQIRLIQRYGHEPILSIIDGEVKVKMKKSKSISFDLPFAKSVSDLMKANLDMAIAMNEAKQAMDVFATQNRVYDLDERGPVHPRFGAKYQPKQNPPNYNKPRKKSKRKK